MSDFRPLALPVGHNWHLMYSVKFEKKNADTADMAVLQADVLLSLTNAKFLPIMAFLSIVRWCTKIEKYQVSFLLEGISRAVWVQITKYGKICAIALLCMFNFLCFLFFTFFKLWTGWIFRNICCRAGWLTVREIINLKGYIL